MAMCVYKYLFNKDMLQGEGVCVLNQAWIQEFILEERPLLAKCLGTVQVPSGSRAVPSTEPRGRVSLKLLEIKDMRSI